MKLSNTVRWILVLPAAIGAFAGMQILILIGTLVGFLDSSEGGGWTQFISVLLCPAAFVWCGSKTAPAHRRFTAICLTVLFSMLAAISGTLVFARMVQSKTSNGWFVVCALVGIASSIVACYAIYEKETEHREAELNEWGVKGRLAGENALKETKGENKQSAVEKFSNN